MKRNFTKILAAFALLVFTMPSLVAWGQTRTEKTYDFSQISGFSDWGTSYNQHVVEYEDATVTFASANHQTSTITDIPVTKGQPVSLVLKETTNSITSATFVCRQWGTKAQTITLHYSTDGGSNYTSTNITSTNFTISSTSLPEGTNAVKITFSNSSNQVGIESATINFEASSSSAVATQVTIDATGITNTDVHTSTEAGSLSATVSANGTTISGATVTWTSSDEEVATIDANGVVTLVAAGTTTITAAYAGVEGQYLSSSATYQLEVTDSTPFAGGDVTFKASEDKDLNNTTQGVGSITKNGVTFACSDGILGNGSEYRLYKNSTTTFSTTEGTITQIVFTQSGNYSISNLTPNVGNLSENTWTGNASSVSFTAGAQTRASQIVVTVNLNATPDPAITANNVNIAYNATGGEITYAIENPVDGASLEAVVATGATISNFDLGTVGASPITFTCDANTEGSVHTATVTLNYMKNGETLATKDVTVTQAAAPMVYNSIEALFNAATSTETDVIVGFDGWVVTGVKGSQAFVSDGTNGLIIYQSDHGFEAGNTLTGTISCRLVLYYGAAELKGITSTTEDLTVGEGGSVTPQVLTASQMTNGIKTGAVVTFENLSYEGTNFSDGTNTITVKTDMYDYSNDVESGNSYNITGVYEHSLRIYPRSAADIEEYTPVTVSALYNYSINGVEGEAIDAVVGETITLAEGEDINEDYTFAGWTTNASNVNERLTDTYTLTEEVTTFYAVYAHTTGASSGTGEANYVKITNTDDLSDGNYLIVYEDALVAFDGSLETLDATGNTIEVEIEEGVIAANEAVNASAFTISAIEGGYSVKSASGYYIGTSSYNNELKTSKTNVYVNAISFDEDNNVLIQMSYDNGNVTLKFNSASNQARFRYYKSGQQSIQLYKYSDGSTPGTISYYTYVGFKSIGAYEGDGGYYLIASPAEVDPAIVEGMTEGTFDLYYYDQDGDGEGNEWINYRASETTINHFNLVPGTGYLYANSEDVTLTFAGTHYVGNGQVPVIAGYNLVGNPFAVSATPSMPYYRLNNDGSGLNASTESSAVNAMEGVFVNATAQGTVTFSTTAPVQPEGKIALNVSQNRGDVIDRAIVRFDEGQQLPKFQLFENSTKLYIPQGNKDFAIVRSAAEGEMPVSFKASENGTYTLAVETENVEMDYLHLIDNMTGADVDLLATPNYTFEARTNDYSSRFRLVFSAEENGASTDSATFAYFNGTSWTVSNTGDATLQVVDITGRIVSSETINGNATVSLNQPAGIYMLRLVNGNDVKVQKVVVR